jgi:hypothetical protein
MSLAPLLVPGLLFRGYSRSCRGGASYCRRSGAADLFKSACSVDILFR